MVSASPASASASRVALDLVDIVSNAPEDLRAILLHRMQISCLGRCAACCSRLHFSLWADPVFWRYYAGPCVDREPRESEAAALRETFRKWLFHLDGQWAKKLRACKEAGDRFEFGADYKQLFLDVRYFACGLMPGDDKSSLQEFVELLCALLAEYSPQQLDERGAAEAAVLQVERREDVFSQKQIREVAVAYDMSVDRAVLDQSLEEREESNPDPWLDHHDLEEGSEHGSVHAATAGWGEEAPGAPPLPPLAANQPREDFDSFWRSVEAAAPPPPSSFGGGGSGGLASGFHEVEVEDGGAFGAEGRGALGVFGAFDDHLVGGRGAFDVPGALEGDRGAFGVFGTLDDDLGGSSSLRPRDDEGESFWRPAR